MPDSLTHNAVYNGKNLSRPPLGWLLSFILGAEKRFYLSVIIYGLVISLFTLAIPISVQALINSVTSNLLLEPVLILSFILVILLLFSSMLNAIQVYIMEKMERHLYARLVKDMTLRLLYAEPAALDGINRTILANRYFEIMHMQKSVPTLLVRGFAMLLQAVVGLILVSFYHPYLFVINIITVFVCWLIWRLWKNKALTASIKLSSAKYETSQALNELARSYGLFRSERHTLHACATLDGLTGEYIHKRVNFFRHYFSQHLGYLGVYAIGSAALLAVGGWLVVKEQLTIGQLVAAELIMSAIFYGIQQSAFYLQDIYQLYAGCAKMHDIYKLPLQPVRSHYVAFPQVQAVSLAFEHVRLRQREVDISLDFSLPAGSKIMAHMATQYVESVFLQLLRRKIPEYQGRIAISDVNIIDLDPRHLQDGVVIIDNNTIVECSIRDWLLIAKPDATEDELLEILRFTELDDVVMNLPEKLDTPLRPYGYPLHFSEVLRLKLAAALLTKPSMLIINGLFDSLSHGKKKRIFARINKLPLTFLYCSYSHALEGFDYYMNFTHESQYLYEGMEDYEKDFD